jgi:hypothetical protein
MGKGPVWKPKEREGAATAWFRATNNGICGADQKLEDFQEQILDVFKLLAPQDAKPGTYTDRSGKAVYVFLRDQVFPDINKFNDSLRLIQRSQPTGCNDDNKISMAIALHTINQVKRLDYSYKDYDHNKWPNYLAWKVLRQAPKFRPPSPLNSDFSDALLSTVHGRSSCSPSLPPCSTSITNTAVLDNQIEVFQEENFQFSSSSEEAQTPIMAQAAANNTGALSSSSSDSSFLAGSRKILDPASHGGRGAEMGNKKAKREHDKKESEEKKEKRFEELKAELREQTNSQKRLVQIMELRQLLKMALAMKDQKMIKEVNDSMRKILGQSSSTNKETRTTMMTTTTKMNPLPAVDETTIASEEESDNEIPSAAF